MAQVFLGEEHDSLFVPVSAKSLVLGKKSEDAEKNEKEGTLFGELNNLQSLAGVNIQLYVDDIEAALLDPNQSNLTEEYLAWTSSLLNQLYGMQMNPNIKLSGSSNDPTIIDPRFLEFGRVGYIIHVPLPADDVRGKLFDLYIRNLPLRGVNFDGLIEKTSGYTPRIVSEIVNTAGRNAMKRAAKKAAKTGESYFEALERVGEEELRETPILQEDFEKAFEYVTNHVKIDKIKKLDDEIRKFCNTYNERIGFI
jgi:SpoVK/Ycf46/Vps4 family AAA+-type ATPase